MTRNKTIKIGYFLQESQPPYRIGAIKMAVDQAQADGLLPDYNYRYARSGIHRHLIKCYGIVPNNVTQTCRLLK